MYCTKCGREVPQNHAFCGHCGAPAYQAPPAPQPEYQAPEPEYRAPQPEYYAPKPKKNKKNIIIGVLCAVWAVVLLLAIILIATSCGKDSHEEPVEPADPESGFIVDPEPGPEEPEPEPEPGEDAPAPVSVTVSDAFYDDSCANSYGGGVFAIPQINLEGSEIQRINEEIYNEFYPTVQEIIDNWDPAYGGSQNISYEWNVNHDILSLIICSHPVDWDWTDYAVYNISISEGRQLSLRDLTDYTGEDDFYDTARKALETRYWEKFPNVNYDNAGGVDFFNEQLHNTRSSSNIDLAMPYLNEWGELCMIARVYSLAGAEYYLEELNLEHFDYLPRYSEDAKATEHAGDYILPGSDSRRITESELYGLDEQECWLALNEIYARHGRLFARAEFADYFNSKDWYYGYIDGDTFDRNANSYLSSTEQANIATIVEYQKAMGWR